jgi:hypothetical protein
MGYYYVITDDSTDPDPSQRGKVAGIWLFPNKTAAQAAAILKPMEDHIRTANWGDKVTASSAAVGPAREFNEAWLGNQPEAVGVDGRLGAWLLGKEGLSKDLNTLKTQLQKTTPTPQLLVGHVIAGKGVKNAKIPGGSNAVLPAWRNAYAHVVLSRSWPYLNVTAKEAVTTALRETWVPALKALQPESGAYMNEADPTNPDWKNDYFGAHYQRLLQIKKQWDPTGVFWCKPCVGHELWEVQSWTADGEGVGQDGERLCLK